MKTSFICFRCFLAALMLSFGAIADSNPVKLRLAEGADESLIVYLQRVSSEVDSRELLYINGQFNLGPTGGRGDLELLITDTDGTTHEMEANINSISLQDRDLQLFALRVNGLVGIAIPFTDIKAYYELPSGKYFVKARYRNALTQRSKRNEFTGVIESETIQVLIP